MNQATTSDENTKYRDANIIDLGFTSSDWKLESFRYRPVRQRVEMLNDSQGKHHYIFRVGTIIPLRHAWFWSDEWQMLEREAEEDIALGRVSPRFESVDAMMDQLKAEIVIEQED